MAPKWSLPRISGITGSFMGHWKILYFLLYMQRRTKVWGHGGQGQCMSQPAALKTAKTEVSYSNPVSNAALERKRQGARGKGTGGRGIYGIQPLLPRWLPGYHCHRPNILQGAGVAVLQDRLLVTMDAWSPKGWQIYVPGEPGTGRGPVSWRGFEGYQVPSVRRIQSQRRPFPWPQHGSLRFFL
ncbi:hypothetical protein KIL84_020945 [Mauremys mutica]|uniref:Uncharacterized protein n=1 Tax=Mauremys mutica TaxID=74926 RepID=A0A9D3XAL5_9SAUR|nr:hypothetical protein KIL84_020945 [Mauremys mutica]